VREGVAKFLIHLDAGDKKKYPVWVYYYDVFGGKKATKPGSWNLHFELLEGIVYPLAKKIDERVLVLEVVEDGLPICPEGAALDAGDVVALWEFMQGSTPTISPELYAALNLLFLALQAKCKVNAKDAVELGNLLPSVSGTKDPEIIARALDESTEFKMYVEHLSGRQYKITLTYSASTATIYMGGKQYSFFSLYDRTHLHILLPKGFEVIDKGDAFGVAKADDDKVEVAWFDYYTDKLLTSPKQSSHSIVVSIPNPGDFILEGYAYFEVGPFDRSSLGSFAIVDYEEWKEDPAKIVWVLFATKRGQKGLSFLAADSGPMRAFEVSSNSTILQVSNHPEFNIFSVTLSGPIGTRGQASIKIPRDVLRTQSGQPDIHVSFDGKEVPFKKEDLGSVLLVSLSYAHSAHVLELRYGTPMPWPIITTLALGTGLAVAVISVWYVRRGIGRVRRNEAGVRAKPRVIRIEEHKEESGGNSKEGTN